MITICCIQFHREYSRVVPRSECGHFAVQTLKWAKQWAEFVTKFVHRGDGSPQLWAAQSFQFLVFSTSPQFTMKLSEKEYIVSNRLYKKADRT